MPKGKFNGFCEELLVTYHRRNSKVLVKRLEDLCKIFKDEGNHAVQTIFGGSVQKGTYVTGLSDVDVLLIVNKSSLVNQPPSKVKNFVRDTIKQRFPNNPVHAGKLAVTIKYADKTEIQLLPAIRTKTRGVRIAHHGTRKWSKVAHPEKFAEKLAEVNAAKDGRAVPAIKLAKAMADCFITRGDRKLSGYHIESLAIDAFSDYLGPLDTKTMLNRLFKHSTNAVLEPIVDSTGQSRFVDEYLGVADSIQRKRASTYFGQMRRLVNTCETKEAFNAFFCMDDQGRCDMANVEIPPEFKSKGNLNLLDESLTALFCSNRCPGDVILKTYDLARSMRDSGVPVIGGFQTPMERECLRLLLRGTQPVVVCPARGIDDMRVPRDWRSAIDEGRLLILSPFPATIRRPTVEIAARRNELVASLAKKVFIAHAAPGSKTEALARELAIAGKTLLTLDNPANANLNSMGAIAFKFV